MLKMEKDYNNKKDDIIKIVYETIKSKEFIQDLWLDVLSDIKEKPSYIRLKAMVENIIQSSVESYPTKATNDQERLQTRQIFSSLSIMTYTIDTLISEILHKKLNDEFKTIVNGIVKDVENTATSAREKKNDFVNMLEIKQASTKEQNNSVNMLENIGEILCNREEQHKNTVDEQKFKQKILSHNENKRKYMNKKNKNIFSDGDYSDTDFTNVSEDDILSIDGNYSISSDISSVHTSDLSSFEDNISISSEDEAGIKRKRRVPLQLANDLYICGQLSGLYELYKNKDKQKVLSKSSPENSDEFTSKKQPPQMRKRSCYPPSRMRNLSEVDSATLNKEKITTKSPHTKNNESGTKRKAKRGRPRKHSYDIDQVNKIIGSHSLKMNSNMTNKPPQKLDTSSSGLSNTQTRELSKRERKPKIYKDYVVDRTIDNNQQTNYTSSEKKSVKVNVNVRLVKLPMSVLERYLKKGSPNKQSYSELSTSSNSSDYEKNFSKEAIINARKRTVEPYSEPEVNRKRGRPSKQELLLRQEKTFEEVRNSQTCNQDSEKKIKKPTPEKDKIIQNKSKTNGSEIIHSTESFSILEESLFKQCSPSKSSTKSYSKTDLYKPHSDFRLSLNSKGSKALTLFSN